VVGLTTDLVRARGVDYRLARERLDREHANLRAAVRRLLDDGDGATVGLLVRNAATYLRYRGAESEAAGWLDAALTGSGAADPAARGRLLLLRAVLASVIGEGASVPRLLGEAAPLLPDDPDFELDRALATIPGIQVAARRGLQDGAREADEALARFTALGLEAGQALMHVVRGDLALAAGDADRATRHYRSAVSLSEELGEDGMLGRALTQLGASLLSQGELADGRRTLLEGAHVSRRSGRPTPMAFALEGLAALALAEDRPALAVRTLAVAAAARSSQALPLQPPVLRLVEELDSRARVLLGDAAVARERAEARSWSLSEALDRALEELAEPVGT
jgi:tetratricopeptide (TPR) repeat protein